MKISEENKSGILKIIRDYVDIDTPVSPESDIINDLGLSSFDAVMICGTVQEQLGIAVEVNLLLNCKTVGDLLEVIEE